MRIIGGKYKGKRLNAPKTKARPTTDFAKEALFNILHHQIDIEAIAVLDLFSGIGSVSFEFASRGCADIWSVEKERRQTHFIHRTAGELELDAIKVIQADVFSFLSTCQKQFDIIFADPPYASDFLLSVPDKVLSKNILLPGGMLIVEHDKFTDFSSHPNFESMRKYGNVQFSFFEK